MVVVATTFVRDARSKRGDGGRDSKSPSAGYRKVPNDFSANSLPRCVTATDAAGNARAAMASRRIANAAEKVFSWASNDSINLLLVPGSGMSASTAQG